MSGIKIHSNIHFFFQYAVKERGSAEHLYCIIQNSVSNTAVT